MKTPLDFVTQSQQIEEEKQLQDRNRLKRPKIIENIVPAFQTNSSISSTDGMDTELDIDENEGKTPVNTEHFVPQKNKTENAKQRDFIKPVGFKGSILHQYKKHWDEEEKGLYFKKSFGFLI